MAQHLILGNNPAHRWELAAGSDLNAILENITAGPTEGADRWAVVGVDVDGVYAELHIHRRTVTAVAVVDEAPPAEAYFIS